MYIFKKKRLLFHCRVGSLLKGKTPLEKKTEPQEQESEFRPCKESDMFHLGWDLQESDMATLKMSSFLRTVNQKRNVSGKCWICKPAMYVLKRGSCCAHESPMSRYRNIPEDCGNFHPKSPFRVFPKKWWYTVSPQSPPQK